jgi:hypothetical protein
MRKYPTHYGLWWLMSGGLFLVAVATHERLIRYLPRDQLYPTLATLLALAACVAFGWVAQAGWVVVRSHFSETPRTEQAADYVDPPPDRPG